MRRKLYGSKIDLLINLAYYTAFTVAIGACATAFIRQAYIKRHLEPDALLSNIYQNNALVSGISGPLVRNSDVNDDGSYESVLIYKQDGRTFYQVMRKTEKGVVLEEQKSWK